MAKSSKGLFTKRLKEIFQKEQFYPSLLGVFINPYYFARKALKENIEALSGHVAGNTLDVGCGQKPYKKVFLRATNYIGLELGNRNYKDFKSAEVIYGGTVFPFRDSSFDSVVAFEVLEHVFNPEEFLGEIYRILKGGGVLLMSVSFIWDEHEQPFDYGRYTSFGLKFLLDKYGFEILEHRKTLADIRVIFQIINAFLYKKIETKNAYLNLLATLFFISPLNITGEILSKILLANSDFYLDNVILARKKGLV